MNRLKNENLNKCFSLLREFIQETSTLNNKKKLAVLALNQLQNITAGTDSTNDKTTSDPEPDRGCIDIPKIDENPNNGNG